MVTAPVREQLKRDARRLLSQEGITCKEIAERLGIGYRTAYDYLTQDADNYSCNLPVRQISTGVKAHKVWVCTRLGIPQRMIAKLLLCTQGYVSQLLKYAVPVGNPFVLIQLTRAATDADGANPTVGAVYECREHDEETVILRNVETGRYHFVKYNGLIGRVELVLDEQEQGSIDE